MSVHGGDGGSGNFGGFWDQSSERALGPWVIGVAIAVGFAVMGSIMYIIFFTDTKAGSDSGAQALPTGPAAAEPSTPAHTLTVPTAFDGYKPATGTTAKHALTAMHVAVAGSTSAFAGALAKAQSGVYDKGAASSGRVMFIAVSAADSTPLATELSTRSAASEASGVLAPFKVTKSHSYSAGALGGALRCGQGKTTSGTATTVCGWADKATSAVILEPTSLTGTAAGKVALALRNAVEQ